MKIELTIRQLKSLLDQQKELVIDRLFSESYIYNKESTSGESKSLPIDGEKFIKSGKGSKYPNDFIILERYLPKEPI